MNDRQTYSIDRGHVLIAASDQLYANYLKSELMTEGYHVECAISGNDVISRMHQNEWNLLIIDDGMLDMSGLEICRRVRLVSRWPIMMCAKHFNSAEIVAALDCGVDACFLRQTPSEEILAQARALQRRIRWESIPYRDVYRHVLKFKDLELNQANYTLRRGNELIPLSEREFQLLAALMGHVDIVLRRDELLSWVWGYPKNTKTTIVDAYIQRLRRKLASADRPRNYYIVTVRNIGYIMRTLTIN
ncbi:MAG: response regulator transcription factor [Aerococcus sp.]|nr:response regulator transcription factor [Aerococcus sp.]